MEAYSDTFFLCSIYREQTQSSQADLWMRNRSEPLVVSPFLLLEFRQSVRFHTWLYEKDKTRGYSIFEAEAMLRDLQSDLISGVLRTLTPDWDAVLQITETLSAKHTEITGNRLADVIHVATAVHFGSPVFLSFDGRQCELAKLEGMQIGVS